MQNGPHNQILQWLQWAPPLQKKNPENSTVNSVNKQSRNRCQWHHQQQISIGKYPIITSLWSISPSTWVASPVSALLTYCYMKRLKGKSMELIEHQSVLFTVPRQMNPYSTHASAASDRSFTCESEHFNASTNAIGSLSSRCTRLSRRDPFT